MCWEVLLALLVVGAYLLKMILYDSRSNYWVTQGIPFLSSRQMAPFWPNITFQLPFHAGYEVAYKTFKALNPPVKFGGIYEYQEPVAFVIDLDFIRLMMVKDFDHFVNRRTVTGKGDPTLVHLMLSELPGPQWKNMRSAMSPIFSSGKIAKNYELFRESATKMNEFVREGGIIVDVTDIADKYVLDVFSSAFFGVQSQIFCKENNSTFVQMGKLFVERFTGRQGIVTMYCANAFPSIFKLAGLSFLEPTSAKFFETMIKASIKHRRETGDRRVDFLQSLLDAQAKEKGSDKIVWTDENILAQSVMFIGSFTSVSSLVSYSLYELALQPRVQEKLFSQVKEAGNLSYEVIQRLEYLDMVVNESLRKHPPAIKVDRKCTKDYKVPGTTLEIKKGTVLAVPVRAIHFDPEIYSDPDKYIPERFSGEEKARRHPYAYLPFGVGPRNCIAQRFALTQGKAALANFIIKFRVKPTHKTLIPMKYASSWTQGPLKPSGPVWLKITPR